MNVESFLQERKSVREFKKGKLSSKDIDAVKEIIEGINGQSPDSIMFRLFEKGDLLAERLDGLGGYAGVMISAPHYICMGLMDQEVESLVYGSYYMEKMVTELSERDIASCWVTVFQIPEVVKQEMFGADLGDVNFVLAIGKAKGKSIFQSETFSERKPISEVVFDGSFGKGIEDFALQSRGLDQLFNFVRYAPSKGNAQPWRYLVKDNSISLYVEDFVQDPMKLIDAGIAMYYFEGLASRIGARNKWELVELGKRDVQGEFMKLATYQL